jgi:hypothetical protein
MDVMEIADLYAEAKRKAGEGENTMVVSLNTVLALTRQLLVMVQKRAEDFDERA